MHVERLLCIYIDLFEENYSVSIRFIYRLKRYLGDFPNCLSWRDFWWALRIEASVYMVFGNIQLLDNFFSRFMKIVNYDTMMQNILRARITGVRTMMAGNHTAIEVIQCIYIYIYIYIYIIVRICYRHVMYWVKSLFFFQGNICKCTGWEFVSECPHLTISIYTYVNVYMYASLCVWLCFPRKDDAARETRFSNSDQASSFILSDCSFHRLRNRHRFKKSVIGCCIIL